MADICDKASDLADLHLRHALHNQRIRAKSATSSSEGIGMCLSCGEPIDEDGRRFCDKDCADDFEAQQRKRRG